MDKYDFIVIGAGSVGVPLSYYLAKEGMRVLVIEKKKSVGQGSNKAAIGGIRATHSNPAKIIVGKKSLEIFAKWHENHNIEWYRGGYSFVAYTPEIEKELKELVKFQRSVGLNIEYLERDELLEKIQSLNHDGLRGGTFSPEDGSASPLLTINSFYREAKKEGAKFMLDTEVKSFAISDGKISEVKTTKGNFKGDIIINAAGAWGNIIQNLADEEIPVKPDVHEAGITEPVKHFLDPMIVDLRSTDNSANFYFYQHSTGQVIFCLTPKEPRWGFDISETSFFLPVATRRMIGLVPRLANIRIRRTWAGIYPMTPDGNPIVGFSKKVKNLFVLGGMCGQGFMLGPGLGYYLARYFKTGQQDEELKTIFTEFNPYRDFGRKEKLK